jgi:hypothetical protein
MLKKIIVFLFVLIILVQIYLLRSGAKTINELQTLKEQAEQRVDSLRFSNDSLNIVTDYLFIQLDSVGEEINKDEKQLENIKNDYKKRIDYISKLSSNELTEYFSNRYNNN